MKHSADVSESLFAFDQKHGSPKYLVCGVDEAGRGPLCGPVTVAAVILDPNMPLTGLNDSKKITEKKREILFDTITQTAKAYAVIHVPPSVIDEINILNATMQGMAEAVKALEIAPDVVLVDGNRTPEFQQECYSVVKGDAHSACIAAASVLAKVSRDRLMCQLALEYPQYKLEQHKGYPTKLHYELIEKHGVAPIYRKSFLKKRGLV